MVIKNQFLADPENSPPRNVGGPSRPSVQTTGSNEFLDDPWYKSSPSASPVVGGPAPTNYYAPNQYPTNSAPITNQFYSAPNPSTFSSYNTNGEEDYENEPPLLEELGIRFDHIWAKTQAVLYLNKPISEHILDDTDLAGPLCFCLLLGALLLLSGKVHFGYIYGFSVFGCIGFQLIISLIHPIGLDFWRTCSVLGYCLLPVIFLAALAVVLNMKGLAGLAVSIASITWSTLSATRLIDASLNLTEQYWLVAYPVMLLYSCFVLITIF